MSDFSGSAFLLNVPDDLQFDRLSRILIDQYPAIELTPLGDYHITAVYMPDSDGFTPVVTEPLPFFANVIGYAVWENRGDGYPIVLLVEKSEPITDLQRRLYEQAVALDMPLSPFSNPDSWQPHITLGYLQGDIKPDPILNIPEMSLYIGGITISDKTGAVGYIPLVLAPVVSEYDSDEMDTQEIETIFNDFLQKSVIVENKPSLFSQIKSKVMNYLHPFKLEFDTPTGFKVYKENYWIAWYSNSFIDRDREYFKQKAIERDIEYMNATGDYPELWRWHIGDIKSGLNPTRHGKAFYVDVIGKFAVAIGKFDDTPIAQQFKAYYKANPKQALSHGFFYTQKEGDTYTEYHTFEISTLPPDVAANPYTTFLEFSEEKAMNVNERAVADLKAALGDEQATALLNTLNVAGAKATETLDSQGVAFKALPVDMETEEDGEDTEKPKKVPKKKEATEQVDLSPVVLALGEMTKALQVLNGRIDAIESKQQSAEKTDEKQTVLHDERKQALLKEMTTNRDKDIKARDLMGSDALFAGLHLDSKQRSEMGIKGF